MLLNILHTIAITCAVGTNFYSERQLIRKPQPNRTAVVTHYERTMTLSAENQVKIKETVNNVNDIPRNTTYNYKQEQTFTNEYFSAQVIEASTVTTITGISGAIIGEGTNKLEHIENRYPYTNIIQRMICIKLNPTYSNQNTHMIVQHNDVLQSPTEEKQYGIYSMMYTTRRSNLNNIFDNEGLEEIRNTYLYRNNNNYDAFMELIYGYGGYDGAITYDFTNIGTSGSSQYGSYQLDREIQIMPRQTNYYIIYEENRLISENEGYNGISGLPREFNPTINITISADNVVTSGGATEVVDLPGTMFTVLGMPFTFISQAFNLTIFPGTPYEVNISLLLLGVLAVGIFVFLVRIIIGYFSKG